MLGGRRWNRQPILPSRLAVAEFLRWIRFLNPGQRLGKPALPRRLALRHDLVFQFGEGGEKFAGFERFDNEAIGTYATRFVRLERLQLAHSEQHRDARGL